MAETVSFAEFSKLELRVGKIMEVGRVEGSNKLYKLQVRVGGEERTLVAGLAQAYAEDELLGKLIVVVCNLERKTLKGIESQGMLLAAETADGEITLLAPDRPVADGSAVR
ncbi:MAG: methionine--tRNA ligase [Candidatus Micrarchaeota archaeon]